MNPVILFWSIPFLATLSFLFTFYSKKLSLKYYESGNSSEAIPAHKNSFSEQIAQFCVLLIASIIGPLLLWAQGQEISSEFIFLVGFANGFFASFIIRAIGSILMYKFLNKNAHLIGGQAIFKISAIQKITAGIVLLHFILIALLAIFIPSTLFIWGAIFGIGFLTVGNYF